MPRGRPSSQRSGPSTSERASRRADRLLQSCGGFAGRGDERQQWPSRRGLLGEQRGDRGNGRRLARSRPARDDRERMARGRAGGTALRPCGGIAQQAVNAPVDVVVGPGQPRGRRAARAVRRRLGAPRASSGRGRARRRGGAVGEVVRRPRLRRRRAGWRRAAAPTRRAPARAARPHRRVRRRRRRPSRAAKTGQRGRDRAVAPAPRMRSRARPRDRRRPRSLRAVWRSGRRPPSSTPASLNARSRSPATWARRTEKGSAIARGDVGHALVPWSSRSLSRSIRRPGGRHAKTPQRSPSTIGVDGPVIPRRNR